MNNCLLGIPESGNPEGHRILSRGSGVPSTDPGWQPPTLCQKQAKGWGTRLLSIRRRTSMPAYDDEPPILRMRAPH